MCVGRFLSREGIDDLDVTLGWLDVQHFALIVADYLGFLAALSAHTLPSGAIDGGRSISFLAWDTVPCGAANVGSDLPW